jgi:hypothetical protein
VNGCSLGLKPISCKSWRAARSSFVFPLMSRILPSMLSITFFPMCMTSRLCRNKLYFQYGNRKKTLFFFHMTSSIAAYVDCPIFRFFFFACPHSHPQIPSPPTVLECHHHFARRAHILVFECHQMLSCCASKDDPSASIACAPYNKISYHYTTI